MYNKMALAGLRRKGGREAERGSEGSMEKRGKAKPCNFVDK